MNARRSFKILPLLAAWLTLVPLGLRATTVIPPEFDTLAAKSDYVVRGRVTAMNSELVVKGESRKIITRVTVEVLEVIAGTPPPELVLVCLGGRVGDEELVVDGAPVFHVGEESVLFVSGNGRALSPLYAMSYGHYPVRTDESTKRRYVARGNDVPLESVAEVAQPLREGSAAAAERASRKTDDALSPEEFSKEIKAAVRRNVTADENN